MNYTERLVAELHNLNRSLTLIAKILGKIHPETATTTDADSSFSELEPTDDKLVYNSEFDNDKFVRDYTPDEDESIYEYDHFAKEWVETGNIPEPRYRLDRLDIGRKTRQKLECAGINPTDYSRDWLHILIPRLTKTEAQQIAVALGKLGLHLRGEKVHCLDDDITESPDIERDNKIILELLDDLGYPELDFSRPSHVWVLEAIRFAMNNPKASNRYKLYLWPKIAEREHLTIPEVVERVRSCVLTMNPRWKTQPADSMPPALVSLMDKIFETKDRYIPIIECRNRIRYSFELRNIGVYARSLRTAEDIGE